MTVRRRIMLAMIGCPLLLLVSFRVHGDFLVSSLLSLVASWQFGWVFRSHGKVPVVRHKGPKSVTVAAERLLELPRTLIGMLELISCRLRCRRDWKARCKLRRATSQPRPVVAETALNPSLEIYTAIDLAGCGLVLVGWFFGRRSGLRQTSGKNLQRAAVERSSPWSGSPSARRPLAGSVPQVGRAAGQLDMLERHLRTAIFDPGARERLVADALRRAGGNRAVAIRQVLSDLESEDRRWS
jgi:hypothetical protein